MKYKYLFGPVPSRRLGVSLGIDVVPFKTCTLNCVYCECGRTTNLTTERKEYVPADKVMDELRDYLKDKPKLDYITFSGSGEPTLNVNIGDIIDFLKQDYPNYKIALLTNGTLFTQNALIDEVKNVDLIVPSLDAASPQAFKAINRPHKSLDINEISLGLSKLKKVCRGTLWLEIFIVPGINDTQKELKLLKDEIKKINPDKVQVNSLDRPPAESWVMPLEKKKLEKISSFLENAEVITNFDQAKEIAGFKQDKAGNILSLLKRRPCTKRDICKVLSLHEHEVSKYLRILSEQNKITCVRQKRGMFYKLL